MSLNRTDNVNMEIDCIFLGYSDNLWSQSHVIILFTFTQQLGYIERSWFVKKTKNSFPCFHPSQCILCHDAVKVRASDGGLTGVQCLEPETPSHRSRDTGVKLR